MSTHAATEIRPATTVSEDRAITYRQALLLKAGLPHGHPGHSRLDTIIERNRPLILAQLPADLPPRDHSAAVVAWATLGAALFAGAGAALPSTAWAITLGILGALALTIAFDRSDAA